ncbi:EAL domain-containing protein [Pseudomonas sp.]|uniref:putative bifunctional diguanylate cyclase/phosphodiesterase n=1 Tax=Pseudomonas sp. TaxID=306 RepID=UPI002600BFA2|nr:EAL domain-containing protein [Pseudomonas sp.]
MIESLSLIDIDYNLWIVGLSFAIASFASYVALNLAKRVRTTDRFLGRVWWGAGSMAMGTGIWSMHFVGMQAAAFPFAVGFGYALTGLSWVAAVAVSAIALYIASRTRLSWERWVGGSLAMGAGICSMHYIGMAAMALEPGIHWSVVWVIASAGIAVIASAAALQIFFGLRRLQGRAARWGQLAAALVMGAAICGMHYTGMAAAGFPENAVCRSVGELRGDSLGLLVAGATIVLLVITSFTSAIDARLQDKATVLATSLQKANAELHQLAFRDALTGLPNRMLLEDRLSAGVERCVRDSTSLAVLFIDLDGFKPVNDSFGHGFGDGVLREMARRLSEQVRTTDTLARLGGDEFVLLVEGNPDTSVIVQIAQRIIDTLAQSLVWQECEVRLSCSVGIAIYPADGSHDKLMTNADAAMYAAKRAGGATFAFFAPRMNAGAREQIELRNDLRLAIERGHLELHYQPKVCSRDGTITGVEALARWHHATRGMIGPDVFIPIAERFGLINALGSWVIEEACRQIAEWRQQGLSLRVAVNLSVHQLRQANLAQRLAHTLQAHRIKPSQFILEVTESIAMEDGGSHLALFEQFGQAGIKLSIDDFGTGYSSLSYLRRLPISQVKIDRSFVRDLESSADARVIVKAIVNLAHALNLEVVAEGVETAAQRDVLRAMDCDELQGFFYARPMAAMDLTQWTLERT